ncbi:VC0807 family protein [Amycolatopsis minnesotensis]|uniref:Intracellular septation protein A n=1 Tax=Amycolatopsis minnesotensis TaxID=337894 RepID=A0ABN2QFP4_9PSEU
MTAPVTTKQEKREAWLRLGASWASDVIVPIGLYYALRALDVSIWWALLAGGIIPLWRTVRTFARTRTIDRIGGAVLVMMVFGTVLSVFTGSPRLLMARESWGTGVFGLWILSTLLGAGEPFLLSALYRVLPASQSEHWRGQWRTSAPFRRALRWMTAAWGVAFVADAIARVVMACTLPLDVVPVLSTVLLIALLVAVNFAGKRMARRAGIDFKAGETDG